MHIIIIFIILNCYVKCYIHYITNLLYIIIVEESLQNYTYTIINLVTIFTILIVQLTIQILCLKKILVNYIN